MTKSNAVYVGMDVHKESIGMAIVAGGMLGEVRHYGIVRRRHGRRGSGAEEIVAQGVRIHIAYEAGSCGYAPYRHLTVKVIDCTVVAPSRIPKREGDPIKTDRHR